MLAGKPTGWRLHAIVRNEFRIILKWFLRKNVVNFLYNNTKQMHQFLKFTPKLNSTCFGQSLCPSSGVYSLYIQQWFMSYRFVDSFRAGPGWNCMLLRFLTLLNAEGGRTITRSEITKLNFRKAK
jgi:hypothetical protein